MSFFELVKELASAFVGSKSEIAQLKAENADLKVQLAEAQKVSPEALAEVQAALEAALAEAAELKAAESIEDATEDDLSVTISALLGK